MKKIIQIALVSGVLLMLFAFSNHAEVNFVGTYGVGDTDSSKIELTLNEDNTFTYTDFSNPSKPIDVKGDWEAKNKQIILKNYTSEFSFHTKWKIIRDGKAVKSRNGITFYTLVKK